MLKLLKIDNIILIKQAEINFANGLCVLSGETGSGKSILLDALGLAVGFRSNSRLIGEAGEYGQVIAEFDISKNKPCQEFLAKNDIAINEDNILIIRRVIKESSVSKVYVNDCIIGVNLLAKIGEYLVEIHGQNDQRGLLNPAFHLKILDNFAKNDDDLQKIAKIYHEFKLVDEKIFEIKQKEDFYNREKDYLVHTINELSKANVYQGEEDELVIKKDKLSGRDKILNFLNEFKNNLLESNSQLIAGQRYYLRSQNIIENYLSDFKDDLENINVALDNQINQIDQSLAIIDDKISEIKRVDDNLEDIEDRLFFIRSLARKYNTICDKLPNIAEEAENNLQKINFDQESIADFELRRQELLANYQEIAKKINDNRQKAAIELSKKVESELKFLKMENVKFLVDIDYNPKQDPRPQGFDKVNFKASINNKNFDEITKIASGGELSRFMLALKVAISANDFMPTMIFDEIDTGIGGAVANSVGIRLKLLSQGRQILVVTHQPQIAAKSDMHLQISKIANDSKVNTIINNLDSQQKIGEIARMLSGENISQEALNAAKKLIES